MKWSEDKEVSTIIDQNGWAVVGTCVGHNHLGHIELDLVAFQQGEHHKDEVTLKRCLEEENVN